MRKKITSPRQALKVSRNRFKARTANKTSKAIRKARLDVSNNIQRELF